MPFLSMLEPEPLLSAVELMALMRSAALSPVWMLKSPTARL